MLDKYLFFFPILHKVNLHWTFALHPIFFAFMFFIINISMTSLWKSFSCVQFFVTPWTVAYQPPLSMELSRQGYWSGLPFPSPGDLPHPGIEPRSPTLQADALPSEPRGKPKLPSILWGLREVRKLQMKSLKLAETGSWSWSKEAVSVTSKCKVQQQVLM